MEGGYFGDAQCVAADDIAPAVGSDEYTGNFVSDFGQCKYQAFEE